MSVFITIEGIEGAGKSTLQRSLELELKRMGREVVSTFEPGGTSLGHPIRDLLLDVESTSLAPEAELLLFAADRAQHVQEIIKPALDRATVVLCDRFTHSTISYQGYGRGLDIEKLHSINTFATDGLKPDLVLLIDLPPEDGLRRVASREDETTRFEKEELDFHQRIREGFLRQKENDPTMFVLDGRLTEHELAEQAMAIVRKHLEH